MNRLSVLLMTDSLFYAVFDENHILVGHKSYTGVRFSDNADMEVILKDETLNSDFPGGVLVAVLSSDHYQLPEEDSHLISVLPGLELKSRMVEKIPGAGIYNYFGITSHQEQLLSDLFCSGYQIKSIPALLSSYFIGEFVSFMHVHLEHHSTSVYVQDQGKMIFYNHFNKAGMPDSLYFILAVMKELGMDPSAVSLRLSGWVENESLLCRQICSYIKNVEFVHDVDFNMSPGCPDELKPHYYFLHFINQICAL